MCFSSFATCLLDLQSQRICMDSQMRISKIIYAEMLILNKNSCKFYSVVMDINNFVEFNMVKAFVIDVCVVYFIPPKITLITYFNVI